MRTSLVLYIKLYFRSPRNERRVIRTTGEEKEYAPLYCRRLHVCHKDTDLDRAPAKVPLHLTYDRLSSLHLSSIGSTATFSSFQVPIKNLAIIGAMGTQLACRFDVLQAHRQFGQVKSQLKGNI